VRHDLAPWRPRLNINRDSGSNTADPAADYFSKLKCLDALTSPVGPTTTTSPSRRASTQMRTKGNPSAFLGIFHFFAQAYFAPPCRVQISHVLPDSTALDRLQAPTNQYKKQHVQLCERLEQLTHKLAHQRTQHIVFMRLQKNGQPRMAVVSKFPYQNCRTIARVIALSFQVPRL
jgi:hypothetical protein